MQIGCSAGYTEVKGQVARVQSRSLALGFSSLPSAPGSTFGGKEGTSVQLCKRKPEVF